ncbi:MAG: pilus (MSHA type) biogenesis protein MshL [Gallionellaceae bacterium CG11_big_fil_rev_8_21_14_0_20_60_62]|nr:MAG: pilus (MSHA type) biogenesis protein MshL [Gallionellaceae bacterium CG11_big_fil_rev_8_21_14_0_20_60_62]
MTRFFLLCAASLILVACGTRPIKPSSQHIQQAPATAQNRGAIPQPIRHAVVLPPPRPAEKVETYSVVVTNLPAREVLFALARDAKINIDIHPGIEGNVTINAINQTLAQILERISQQVAMRYDLNDSRLAVMPDSPYLKNYKIDYVNMSRDSDGGMSNTTQVGGSTASGNNSQLSIKNSSKNHFWDTLVKNITDILNETDKEIVVSRRASSEAVKSSDEEDGGAKTENGGKPPVAAQQKSSEQDFKDYRTLQAASVISNPEAGIITVRATGKQHAKISEFIVQVMRSARRQVLIEATIAEVTLSSNYQQGINWSKLLSAGDTKGFSLGQAISSQQLPTDTTANIGTFILNYVNPTSRLGSLNASVSLLETFGDVKVLSSPKLSVMNNQTAMLRVVDNLVYFTIKADTVSNQTTSTTTFTTTAVTVPTGFTMSVTPQIDDSDTVLLNLRPSITRLLGFVNDPNPSLAAAGVTSRIPQLQTRELESVLKIGNNQIAVMGGLMQDEINNLTNGIPGLGRIPVAGNLFNNRDDTKKKTELVIFLRPVVIKDASIDGDFAAFRDNLPTADFLLPETGKGGK